MMNLDRMMRRSLDVGVFVMMLPLVLTLSIGLFVACLVLTSYVRIESIVKRLRHG